MDNENSQCKKLGTHFFKSAIYLFIDRLLSGLKPMQASSAVINELNKGRGLGLDNSSYDYKKASDEKLVKLILEYSDELALNEIVMRYEDKIYRLALRIARNPSYAEEVLQEVFLTLLKKLDSFREESKFSTWLFRIATNTTLLHIRNEKKYTNHQSLEDYKPYDENGSLVGVTLKDWSNIPEDLLIAKEGMEILENAVNELPEKYKIVFHLRDAEGLTNEEVGNILGLSVPAVKSRVLRARLFLRDKLSDYFY